MLPVSSPPRSLSSTNTCFQASKSKPTTTQAEADKKAERLAKLEAWKKKKETQAAKEKEVNPLQTRRLLAEMDGKPSKPPAAGSPVVESPASASPAPGQVSADASPATSYAGKFDPKAVAKKAAAAPATSKLGSVPLGSVEGKNGGAPKPPATQTAKASALPANRGNIGGFGFQKQGDKLAGKRKINLDEEVTSQRKLVKLPTLPAVADDTPWVDQDEDDSDTGEVGATEEEAAANLRAAHEKRIQQETQTTEDSVDVEMGGEEDSAEPDNTAAAATAATPPPAAPEAAPEAAPDTMEVDEEDRKSHV